MKSPHQQCKSMWYGHHNAVKAYVAAHNGVVTSKTSPLFLVASCCVASCCLNDKKKRDHLLTAKLSLSISLLLKGVITP